MLKSILRRFAKRFRRDERGSFLVIFALSAITLVGITGAALDYARGYLLQSELSSALDAAALAGGANASSPQLQQIIEKYFKVNFPTNYLGADVSAVNFNVDTANGILTASVSAELDYSLLGVVLDGTMHVAADTEITLEKRGMEIALVMDNTGSMVGAKITTMKASAMELVKILYGNKQEQDKMWISLVPYTATVNIGKGNSGWLTSLNQTSYAPTTWKGCIEARGAAEMTDDTAAVGGKWKPFYWADSVENTSSYKSDNDWRCTKVSGNCTLTNTSTCTTGGGSASNVYSGSNTTTKWLVNENACAQNNGTGPNLSCPPPITPLTKSRATVEAAIQAMDAWHRGGTFSNIGLSWGWRTISPKWKGLWSGVAAAQPYNYEEPLMDKVVILLTDGENNFYDHPNVGTNGSDYTAYLRLQQQGIGAGIDTQSEGTAAINTQTAQTCTAMKAQGIIIYTITFQVGNNAIRDVYKNCATSPAYYFDSPNTADLTNVFKAIGDSLSNLRISK